MDTVRVDPVHFGHIGLAPDDRPTLAAWIRRPEAQDQPDLIAWMRKQLGEEPAHGLLQTLETELKYSGYIAQQQTAG